MVVSISRFSDVEVGPSFLFIVSEFSHRVKESYPRSSTTFRYFPSFVLQQY